MGYEASGKVYKSVDYGQTWKKVGDFADARDLMGIFIEDGVIYAVTSGISKIHKSIDGGQTWTKSHQFWNKGLIV